MKYLSSFLLVILLTSCVETIVAGSVATGLVIAREKPAKDTFSDITIETKIIKDFTVAGLRNPANKIGVVVDKQRVLLTGVVDDANMAKKANEICWKIRGVKEVIDEIQVVEKKSIIGGIYGYIRDARITSQIASGILFDQNTSILNIKTITVNRVVYLIGTAKNRREIDASNRIASKTIGVKKVVSHIKL